MMEEQKEGGSIVPRSMARVYCGGFCCEKDQDHSSAATRQNRTADLLEDDFSPRKGILKNQTPFLAITRLAFYPFEPFLYFFFHL